MNRQNISTKSIKVPYRIKWNNQFVVRSYPAIVGVAPRAARRSSRGLGNQSFMQHPIIRRKQNMRKSFSPPWSLQRWCIVISSGGELLHQQSAPETTTLLWMKTTLRYRIFGTRRIITANTTTTSKQQRTWTRTNSSSYQRWLMQ
jgi:hypothetical protein